MDIFKPREVKSKPSLLSVREVFLLLENAKQLRYRVFILATYSLGLRLPEALHLQIQNIDSANRRIHVRRGKGYKGTSISPVILFLNQDKLEKLRAGSS